MEFCNIERRHSLWIYPILRIAVFQIMAWISLLTKPRISACYAVNLHTAKRIPGRRSLRHRGDEMTGGRLQAFSWKAQAKARRPRGAGMGMGMGSGPSKLGVNEWRVTSGEKLGRKRGWEA